MVDFHSHILPHIDDGAKTVEASLKLIREEIRQGIDTILLTPHYLVDEINLAEFLDKRNDSYRLLCDAAHDNSLDVRLVTAAEVRLNAKLASMELSGLCISGTRFILIELPVYHRVYAAKEVLYALTQRGYTPIIAHAERYTLIEDDLLLDAVRFGSFIQMNVDSLFNSDRRRAMKLIKNEMVHLIGSDCHSMEKRPPHFTKAIKLLGKKFTTEFTTTCEMNARSILDGKTPIVPLPDKKL